MLAILIQKESQRYYYQWRWKNHFWREKQLNYCQVFNTSFSKFVSNLNIPSTCNYYKEGNFHSLSAIREHFNKDPNVPYVKHKIFDAIFPFERTNPEELMKGIHNLSIRKKSQTTYFQSKMIKLDSDISAKFI